MGEGIGGKRRKGAKCGERGREKRGQGRRMGSRIREAKRMDRGREREKRGGKRGE